MTDGDVAAVPQEATRARPPRRVSFTQRAYTSLLSEVLAKTPLETGGILLGYRDGADWVVVESTDPGPGSIHQFSYFEYDQAYVNHLINRIRHYYVRPLEVLGLWHRHPGSFDRFSGTDDGTNLDFAGLSPVGAISGLVNVDPTVRLTFRHVTANPLRYASVPVKVLSDKESARKAPLRPMRDMAAAIESYQGSEPYVGADTVSAPGASSVDLSRLADCVAETIRSSETAFRLDHCKVVAWPDERIAMALQRVEGDAQAFGRQGVELDMKLVDEAWLQLIAKQGQHRQPICSLVQVETSKRGHEALCVASAKDSRIAMVYTPGLLQACII